MIKIPLLCLLAVLEVLRIEGGMSGYGNRRGDMYFPFIEPVLPGMEDMSAGKKKNRGSQSPGFNYVAKYPIIRM